jgi:hypothetical protein
MMRPGGSLLKRWGLPVAAGVVLAFILYTLVLHPWPGYPRTMDYVGMYSTARIILDGRAGEMYDLDTQLAYQAPIYNRPGDAVELYGGGFRYNRAPFYVAPILLLALLPYEWSYLVWVLTILAEGALAFWLLATRVYPANNKNLQAWGSTAIIALAFWPVFQGILLGQTSLLELLGLTGFYLLYSRGRTGAAGAVLGLLLFKPQLVLFFLLFLLLRGSWRGLLGFLLVAIVLGVISVAVAGVDGALQYIELTRQNYGWNCIYGVYVEMHQSWRGLFTGLLVTPCALAGDQPEIFTAPALAQADLIANVFNALTIVVATLVLWRWRHSQPGTSYFDLAFAVLMLTSQLASPYSFPQDLTRMVLAAVLLLRVTRTMPGLLPAWLEPRRLIAIAIALGPFATVQSAQRIHPLVWLMVAVFAGLCVVLLRPESTAEPRSVMP